MMDTQFTQERHPMRKGICITDISSFHQSQTESPCTPRFILGCSLWEECLHTQLTCFLRCGRSDCFHCHQPFPIVWSFQCLLLFLELLAYWEHQLRPKGGRNRSRKMCLQRDKGLTGTEKKIRCVQVHKRMEDLHQQSPWRMNLWPSLCDGQISTFSFTCSLSPLVVSSHAYRHFIAVSLTLFLCSTWD